MRRIKTLNLKTLFLWLLTCYSVAVTTLYVSSSTHYKERIRFLADELKLLHREQARSSSEDNIRELEIQKENTLEELKSIREKKNNE